MKISRKTLLNLLLFALVLSFFVTPLGHYGKIFLNRLFAFGPEVIPATNRLQIPDYNWTLKDKDWNFFSFEEAKGKVVFINFWASWRLPCEAELQDIQKLYDEFGDQVVFYIITDEEQEPVEAFMAEQGFDFPVTYRIIGEAAPFEVPDPPASYVLDKQGNIVVSEKGITDWYNEGVRQLFTQLLENQKKEYP
ncbi:MAG: TlpA disulfide reductase family protein [Eudoraea sp.]|nr:TlpA disulfide reductase family protein [Eudoraea sp.]